jgi:hypothetical protein
VTVASSISLLLAANPLEAQQPLAGEEPPQVLQLVIERIKPGNEARYDAIERQLAVLCKERCPNAYLALESFATPKEIYWLTAYRTAADVERIAAAYASNALLRADLQALSAPKDELVESAVTLMLEHRETLSDTSPWLVGILPYAVIVEGRDAVTSGGAVFEAPDGMRLVFAPAANAEDANAVAAALGPGAKPFAVRAEWSKPTAAWIIANPALWSPR